MTKARKFVTAFRGRRDDYQVPLALAEHGSLECFVTDFYAGRGLAEASRILPVHMRESLQQRYKAGLPIQKVKQFPTMAFSEKLLQRNIERAVQIRDANDAKLSREAAAQAERAGADLFLYSAYAAEAFQTELSHRPKKVLFQYHPHFEVEREILREDAATYPVDQGEELADFENVARDRRVCSDTAWRLADKIVCASSFTARSLLQAGAAPDKITVATYGIAAPVNAKADSSMKLRLANDSGFRVLFVGSGIQRKGIHHLLRAWEIADLPNGSELTIVARNFDPNYLDPKSLPKNTKLYRGVEFSQLHSLYASSTLFCMPSLIEGFGQVYLEALASGIPVLGSNNTCLPDIGGEAEGVFIVTPGDVQDLAIMLEKLAILLPRNTNIRERAQETAKKHTWQAFREKIGSICNAV